VTFEEALVARVFAADELTALEQRVDWMRRPGPALPAMTLQTISDPRAQMIKGWSVRRPRVQIDLWSASFGMAVSLREATIAALVPAARVGGVRFQRAGVANVRSGFEQIEAGSDQQPRGELYRESIDFIFPYTPA